MTYQTKHNIFHELPYKKDDKNGQYNNKEKSK